MPVISVVVPVYKVEAYLDRCVKSILAQTFEDFELILVDDGSPDNCGCLCDAWAEKDLRIHVIHQKNGGLSAARNAGIDWAFANGGSQWFTFIDSDDWVHPEMLQRLLNAAAEQQVKISVCGYAETTGAEPAILRETLNAERWTAKAFYLQHFINATIACGKLYHRSCFETVRYPVGKLHEDEFVTYRLLFEKEYLAFLPAPLYAYYINPAGITKNSWSPKRLHAWGAYDQQIAFFEERGDEELVKFRIRGYLENAQVNLRQAQEAANASDFAAEIEIIEKKIRSLIPIAWKHGCIDFWPDFALLYQYYPLCTRAYRLWLEVRSRLRRKHDA